MPDKLEADETMEESAPKAKAKKGKSKLLIIGVPVVLIQLIAGYFIVMWLLRPSMPEKEKKEEVTKTELKKTGKKEAFGLPFTIEKLTINIQSEDKRSRFLVGNIAFECENQGTLDELTKRDVQIRDIVIGTIGSKKLTQLLDNTFIEDTLKTELRDKINNVLMSGQVKSVYFSQRIIN